MDDKPIADKVPRRLFSEQHERCWFVVSGDRRDFAARIKPRRNSAAKLSGKAPVAVALAIWFQVGRRRSKEVRLTSAVIERFGIDRKARPKGTA
jgi:hypothetical protein